MVIFRNIHLMRMQSLLSINKGQSHLLKGNMMKPKEKKQKRKELEIRQLPFEAHVLTLVAVRLMSI